MNQQDDEQLIRDLAALTRWEGPSPEVWRAAAERHDSTSARLMRWVLRPSGLGGLAAAVVLVVGLVIAMSVQERPQQDAMLRDALPAERMRDAPAATVAMESFDADSSARSSYFFESDQRALASKADSARLSRSAPASPSTDAPTLMERMVARRASIEIRAAEVEATVRRITLLVSEAQGEYVQESSFHGAGPEPYATLTLRITSGRCEGVLASIRALGTVMRETSGGEDVTDRAVDLDSRLRNARRVEEELLKLMSSRPGAPLGDILQIGAKLSEVRENIERLQGQRDRLSNLAALATVHVSVRPEKAANAEEKAPEADGAFARAWSRGTASLVASAAKLVEVLVGGLIWWTLLAAAAWFIGRRVVAGLREGKREPPPLG